MQLSKVAFIGGGHMGRALVAALLRAGLPATRIAIGEPDSGQRQALQRLFPDVHVTADNAQAAADAEVVVLAVKPQEMSAVIRPLRMRRTRKGCGGAIHILPGGTGPAPRSKRRR